MSSTTEAGMVMSQQLDSPSSPPGSPHTVYSVASSRTQDTDYGAYYIRRDLPALSDDYWEHWNRSETGQSDRLITDSSLEGQVDQMALEAAGESNGETGLNESFTSTNRYPILDMRYLSIEEPPQSHLQACLDVFFRHASQFGFFLNINSFRYSSLLPFRLGHPRRPTPGLLSVVYLLGVHLSPLEMLQGQEDALMARAIQHVATDMMRSHPNKVIHTLQAEILLAYYLFRMGLLLEAKYHTGTAVTLALGSGLHKIRSTNFTMPPTLGIDQRSQAYTLPVPIGTLEEAERINGFWAAFILHKLISVALETPAHVCGALEAPGMQIDTPWPVDIENYTEGIIQPELQGNLTISAFLNGYPSDDYNGNSATALLVKASVLFHRAAHLTGQWSPDMSSRDIVAYETAEKSVGSVLVTLRSHLGPRPHYSVLDSSVRTVMMTHALVDAAMIKLHWIKAYKDPELKRICLSAARNVVNYGDLDLQYLTLINPIMGNLWMTACLVFIDELARVRQMRTGSMEHALTVEEGLMVDYRNGVKAMSLFSQDSVLMCYQLNKVQEAFESI